MNKFRIIIETQLPKPLTATKKDFPTLVAALPYMKQVFETLDKSLEDKQAVDINCGVFYLNANGKYERLFRLRVIADSPHPQFQLALKQFSKLKK